MGIINAQSNNRLYLGLGNTILLKPPEGVQQRYFAPHGIIGYKFIPYTFSYKKLTFYPGIGPEICEISFKFNGRFISPRDQDTTYIIFFNDTSYESSKFSITYFAIPLVIHLDVMVGSINPGLWFGFKYMRAIQPKQKIVYNATDKIKYYGIKKVTKDIFSVMGGFRLYFGEIGISYPLLPIFQDIPPLDIKPLNVYIQITGFSSRKKSK